jgi:hypothetical protein
MRIMASRAVGTTETESTEEAEKRVDEGGLLPESEC